MIQALHVNRRRLLEHGPLYAEEAVPHPEEIVFDIEENHQRGLCRVCVAIAAYPTTGFCSLILIVVPLVESFSSMA